MAQDVLILWNEGDWRCEIHTGDLGVGRFLVYCGDSVVTAESVHMGAAACTHAPKYCVNVSCVEICTSS